MIRQGKSAIGVDKQKETMPQSRESGTMRGYGLDAEPSF